MSALTAWRFADTEGADAAVLRLKQLDAQDLIDLEDVAVVRLTDKDVVRHPLVGRMLSVL